MSYLLSFRAAWDAGLVILLCLFSLTACANQHDNRAANAAANAEELRGLARAADTDLERDALLEEARAWDARAQAEADAAARKRDDDTNRALEIVAGIVGLALTGGATYKVTVGKAAAKAAAEVNATRDAARLERGEPV